MFAPTDATHTSARLAAYNSAQDFLLVLHIIGATATFLWLLMPMTLSFYVLLRRVKVALNNTLDHCDASGASVKSEGSFSFC